MSWSDEELSALLRALPPAPERLIEEAEALPDFLPDPTLEVALDSDYDLLDDGGMIGPAATDDDAGPAVDADAGDSFDDDTDGGWLHPG